MSNVKLNPIIEEWIRSGVVKPAASGTTPLPVSPVRLKQGTAMKLLKADRRERT